MKTRLILAAVLLTASPAVSAASGQQDVVAGVVKAVKRGDDLNAAYPGAISGQDMAALQRLSKCTAHNLMRQAKGRYTVVWSCGKKVALGMEVLVADDRVTSITTIELVRRPTLDR